MSGFNGLVRRNTLLSLLLVPLGFAASAAAEAATTYHVRTDGGDASQCTGRADAPYPGSGTAQACAWKHPFFALSPSGTKRIAGGDTLVIGGGSYMMGTGAPGAGSCSAGSCFMAPVPSGTSSARTRIIGKAGTTPKLWGTGGVSRVFNLQGSSHVEVSNLEITDQNDCVVGHSQSTAACSSGAYAKFGLYASDSNNVLLADLNIHGLGHTGLKAGRVSNWTLDRVKINANGHAGWDGNVGSDSSNSGAINLRNVEIAWNGCGERWQTGTPWACWAQQTGGYGDGLGMYWTAGKWLIEDSFIHHNTSDGLDLRYMDGADSTHVTVRRSYFRGNAGNQVKIRGSSLVENSVLIGDCGYFEGKYYMVADDNCRANGNSLVMVMTPNDSVLVRHNTITGEGGVLMGTVDGDSTGKVHFQNNVVIGFKAYPYTDGRLASLYYANNGQVPVTYSSNLIWNVKNNACPSGSICGQNPKLTNMSLDTFDAEPLGDSPVIDKVPALSILVTDFLKQLRPSGLQSDIGAFEMQLAGSTPAPPPEDSTCTRAAPVVALVGPTTAVAAGTKVDYTLSLTNKDSSGCANTSFNLARTVPSGWTGTLSATSVTLAPGASSSTTLSVTSASGATAGTYNIAAGTSSTVGSTHTASATATYSVKDVEAVPSSGLSQTVGTNKTNYEPGETVYMSARVLKNGKPVKNAKVRFEALKPNGVNTIELKATTDSKGYARASFASGTGPSSIGTYQLTAEASSGKLTATASTTFSVGDSATTDSTTTDSTETVAPSTTGLTESVATSKANYAAGETVYMAARVLDSGIAVSGASVRFEALKPNGVNTVVLKATTDSDGYARASFVSGTGDSSIGTYQLTAEASIGELSATASTTFSVGDSTTTGFTESVITSKSSYSAGETVYITARVLNDGVAVSGASVRFEALKPNGVNTVVLKGTTDSNGYARVSFVSGTGSSSIGTYKLQAEATSGSLSALAYASFSVM